jgi:ubiquinone/menaquinone biosynthesis C-methylase UbiE
MENKQPSLFICPKCKNDLSVINRSNGDAINKRILRCGNGHSFDFQDDFPVLLNSEDTVEDYKQDAFSYLAHQYETMVDLELSKYWGMHYSELVRKMCDKAALAQPRRLLDISTGVARIPRTLAERADNQISITGIDLTVPMLHAAASQMAAENLTSKINLVCASGIAIPFPDESFDVVTCALGSHHMDAALFLSEARRVLVKNGTLITADAVTSRFFKSLAGRIVLSALLFEYSFIQNATMARVEKEAFEKLKTSAEWKELFEKTGFTEISYENIKPRRSLYPGGMIMSGIRG